MDSWRTILTVDCGMGPLATYISEGHFFCRIHINLCVTVIDEIFYCLLVFLSVNDSIVIYMFIVHLYLLGVHIIIIEAILKNSVKFIVLDLQYFHRAGEYK